MPKEGHTWKGFGSHWRRCGIACGAAKKFMVRSGWHQSGAAGHPGGRAGSRQSAPSVVGMERDSGSQHGGAEGVRVQVVGGCRGSCR